MMNQTRLSATWISATLLTWAMAATPSDAGAILYNLTNLGSSGYQFQTNADGSDYGVTSNSTGVTYAFDKSPTATISQGVAGTGQSAEYSILTLQNGAFKAGYSVDANPDDPPNTPTGVHYFKYPTFESPKNDWIGGADYIPMLADMNKLGQVVGASLIKGKGYYDQNAYYAAFSAPGVQAHGGDASIVDNLNNYIAAQPGMSLGWANAIDDLGRIIAAGTNGYYLLTPVALGDAATVPEPTAVATLGLGGAGWMAYAWRLRRRVARRVA